MDYLPDYLRTAKIRRINQLFSACKLTPNRPDVLALWGANDFEEMTDANLEPCRVFLETAYKCRTTQPTEAVRRLRSQAMTLLNRLGKYATPEDWTEVNRFLLQRKICGRLLYMLNEDEIKGLIRKLRAIADKKPASSGGQGRLPRDAENRPNYTLIDDLGESRPLDVSVDRLLAQKGLLSILTGSPGKIN